MIRLIYVGKKLTDSCLAECKAKLLFCHESVACSVMRLGCKRSEPRGIHGIFMVVES